MLLGLAVENKTIEFLCLNLRLNQKPITTKIKIMMEIIIFFIFILNVRELVS